MTDTSDVSALTRRERERARRTIRRRRAGTIATLAATLLMLGAAALIATDSLPRFGDGPTLAAGDSGSPATRSATLSPDPRIEQRLRSQPPPRTLSHDVPLRVWVGGDSLAGEVGPALGTMAGASGVVKVHVDFKVSSGIANNAIRNWQQRAAQDMANSNPEVAIFMIGANDGLIAGARPADGSTPAWELAYRKKVATMMDILSGSSRRTVFWIGSPPMRDRARNRGVQQLNRVMAEEAQRRSNVVYVDAYGLFSDETGAYVTSMELADGRFVQVRISDGVHFTQAGAQRLAGYVWALIDQRWDVGAVATPQKPIGYTTDPGGGSVPGVTFGSTTTTTRYSGSTSTTSLTTTTGGDGTTSTSSDSTTSTPPTSASATTTTGAGP